MKPPPSESSTSQPPTTNGLRRRLTEPESAFPQTNWTLVLDQGRTSEADPLNSLRHLAQIYWKPLYRFARQRGAGHDDAADQVQGFFEHLLSKDTLEGIEQRETRFRTFLLTCFTNWIGQRRREERSVKRGGMESFVTYEELEAVEKEPAGAPGETPENSYDRRWARAIYDTAMKTLDDEIYESSKPAYLISLKHTVLGGIGGRVDIATVADQFGQTPASARKAAFDLRERFAIHLRRAVRAVVSSDAEVDLELRYMITMLARGY